MTRGSFEQAAVWIVMDDQKSGDVAQDSKEYARVCRYRSARCADRTPQRGVPTT